MLEPMSRVRNTASTLPRSMGGMPQGYCMLTSRKILMWRPQVKM